MVIIGDVSYRDKVSSGGRPFMPIGLRGPSLNLLVKLAWRFQDVLPGIDRTVANFDNASPVTFGRGRGDVLFFNVGRPRKDIGGQDRMKAELVR